MGDDSSGWVCPGNQSGEGGLAMTPLLSPVTVPAGGIAWGLTFRGRGHVRNRCPRSHLKQKTEQPRLCSHKGDEVKHSTKVSRVGDKAW